MAAHKTIYSRSIRKTFEKPDTAEGDFNLSHLKSIFYYSQDLMAERALAGVSAAEKHSRDAWYTWPNSLPKQTKHDVILHLFLDFLRRRSFCRPRLFFFLALACDLQFHSERKERHCRVRKVKRSAIKQRGVLMKKFAKEFSKTRRESSVRSASSLREMKSHKNNNEKNFLDAEAIGQRYEIFCGWWKYQLLCL